eukprot:Platyproteum_vivax@DN8774_c0_g1_i1.p2
MSIIDEKESKYLAALACEKEKTNSLQKKLSLEMHKNEDMKTAHEVEIQELIVSQEKVKWENPSRIQNNQMLLTPNLGGPGAKTENDINETYSEQQNIQALESVGIPHV